MIPEVLLELLSLVTGLGCRLWVMGSRGQLAGRKGHLYYGMYWGHVWGLVANTVEDEKGK